jgi:transposase
MNDRNSLQNPVVDAHGNPVALSVTPGQAADLTQAGPLLEWLRPEAVLADRGYDSNKLVAALEAREVMPEIALQANKREQRACDFALCCERHLVARCFNEIKHYKRSRPASCGSFRPSRSAQSTDNTFFVAGTWLMGRPRLKIAIFISAWSRQP